MLSAAALASVALTGCVSQGCPGWAGYDSPPDAVQAADAVVLGHVEELASTASLFGAPANVWSVEVTEWVKGEGPDTIQVMSPPSRCGPTDDPYFGSDPFEAATAHSASVVLLSEWENGWMGLNPGQGIVELTPSGDIPPEW